MIRRSTILALCLATSAAAQEVPPGWQAVKAKLHDVGADDPVAQALPAAGLSGAEGDFLFESGQSYRYARTDGKLELTIGGRKPTSVEPGATFKVRTVPPGETSPVELTFRRVPDGDDEDSPTDPFGDSPPPTEARYTAAQVVTFKAGRAAFTLLDRDANGYFDDYLVDGWVAGEPKELTGDVTASVQPWRGWINVEGRRFLVTLRPATRALLWPIQTADWEEGYLDHMGVLNQLRRQGGLPPVGVDEALTAACVQHCRYMKQNGLAHAENPQAPGYSPEGNRQGLASVCGRCDDPVDGVRGMFRTLWHRNTYLFPFLRKVAIGFAERFYTCDIRTYSMIGVREPTPYPFDRQAGVDPRGDDEKPNPKPADLEAIAGTLVAVILPPQGLRAVLLESRLVEVSTNEEVACAVSSPAQPVPDAGDVKNNDTCICLYPRQVLRSHTTYEAFVRWRNNPEAPVQELRWRFRTGSSD